MKSSLLRVKTYFRIASTRRLASFAKIDQILVDSFASKPFTGNPASVVFQQRDATWMQNVAAENNTPVTAFLSESLASESTKTYNIRWFTPTKEIFLCGHATLAAAHALYQLQLVPPESSIDFKSLYSGVLTANRDSETCVGFIQLKFPASPSIAVTLTGDEQSVLESVLGIDYCDILYSGRNSSDLIIELKRSAFARISAVLDYQAILSLGGRGLVITCVGKKRVSGKDDYLAVSCGGHPFMNDSNHDFLLRGFFPSIGLNEDSVTGSALCALAPYYHQKYNTHLDITLSGPAYLQSYQASQRGGKAQVALLQSINSTGSVEDSVDRVLISGQCVTIMSSMFEALSVR